MKAKTLVTCALLGVFILMTRPCRVFAQEEGPAVQVEGPAVAVTFSEQELDQMLAPIALYPDSLLAQVLIAATYPDQVMDAYHWMRAHPGLRGQRLNFELDRMDWDLSIKALAPFPQVLAMLAQQPDWTQRLGEAFLAQQAAVMDSVQRLRRRAEAAGNLRTTAQQRVVVTDDYVEIEPVNPEIVYIPRYNPTVVYGTWWWPAYPPLVYYPVWEAPVVFAPVVGVFGFWGAITVGPAWGWGWGTWGWGHHEVYLNVNRGININTTNVTVINRWQSNYQYANARYMAQAGRVGSAAVRTRAFGSAVANPTVLRGHITSGRVYNGQVVTRTGLRPGMSATGAAVGARVGAAGRNFGGSRPGVAGHGFQGARPSTSRVMHELRGGSTGYRGAAAHGSFGGRSNAAFGHGRSNAAFGHGRSNAAFGHGRSNAAFGTGRSNAAFGHGRSNAAFGHQRSNAAFGHGRSNAAFGHQRS
ncbi:MAG: DUF3300 domain-containing protein, partial [Syntrophobacteraceae bacterium]